MRKVLLHMHMTLDGYAEFPPFEGEDADWPGITRRMWVSRWRTVDTLLFGRKTFLDAERHWQSERDRTDKSEFETRASRYADRVEKVVFSRTLKSTRWPNARVVSGDMTREIARMRRLPGKSMSVSGGAGIARAFIEQGLVDEYWLTIFPVVLGRGAPLFPPLVRTQNLRLVETKRFKSGALFLRYARTRH